MPPFSEDYSSAAAVVSPPPSPTTLMEFPAKPLRSESDDDNSMGVKRNRVRFNEKVAVHWIRLVPEAHRHDVYMSKLDFDAIRADCAEVVATAATDTTVETRGLESSLLLGEAFLKAYLHRRGALRAVFKEQIVQKETLCKSPQEIADAYAIFARKSLMEARSMAESDEKAAQDAYA